MEARVLPAKLHVADSRVGSVVTRTRYRPDIDGLRAVAVLSVLLYHAKVPIFGGGFVGVDVFFVISGYLITAILAEENARGRVSIFAFYDRRIRRIFPALFIVLFFTILMGHLLFTDRELRELSSGLIATVLFASNILFWLRYGYFNQNATEPFLHTWSLSVEEQFYIGFPLLLWILHGRLAGRKLVAIVATLTALSFVTSAWWVYRYPDAAFYLTPFRAWELLLGSLIALNLFPTIRLGWLREVAAFAGLSLICLAVYSFTSETIFPGLNASLPCLGAALVIYAGQDGSTATGRLLSLRPIVFVGLISYSLYLWHWPLFVFAKSWNLGDIDAMQTVIVIALSFALATLTWGYIENPFRRKQIFADRQTLFNAASVAMAAGLAIGFAGRENLIWQQRMPTNALRLEAARADFNPRRPECHDDDDHVTPYGDKCVYGAFGTIPQYAIWGDSHAVELVTALGELAGAQGRSILQISYSACHPSIGADASNGRSCRDHNNAIFQKLASDPTKKVVFLNAFYRGRFSQSGFRAVVDGLLAKGKRLVIVYPFPMADSPVPVLLATGAMRGT